MLRGVCLAVAVFVLSGLAWLVARHRPGSRPLSAAPSPAPLPDAVALATYAGSDACRECHTAAYDQWKPSHHARAERPVDPVLDRTAFEPRREFRHGSQTSEARAAGDHFELVTLGFERQREPFRVERVIGVDPLRQFLIATHGGRYQVSELAVDPQRGDWFNVFGEEDRQPGEWGHWTGRGMTWNTMCAACHNTRLRKNYDPAADRFSTRMAEVGVGCESCHGPMADHVRWQRQAAKAGPDPTVRRLSPAQWLAVCGACHSRRTELTGDFTPGDDFFDHFGLAIPDETDVFYPDGQVREEDYELTPFLASRMHAAGVQCRDCHQPHTGKVLAPDNSLCLRCHAAPLPPTPAPVIDPATHSFHPPGSAGDRCVECHMPQTVYMQRHARRDHGFTIPDPRLTKEHGIPNACNRCHTDRSVDWCLEAVEQWYGPRMNRPSRARAQTIARARAGDREALPPLLDLTRTEPLPLWRAVATGLLRPWSHQTNVTAALLERARDPHPLVRAYAARALEPLAREADPRPAAALRALLADPVRAVRLEAAWGLRASLDTNTVAARELFRYFHHNADQPTGLLQAGLWHLDRGEHERATALLRRAVEWDGGSAPLRHALAIALSTGGEAEAAVHELEAACRLAPRQVEYRLELGLALNEAGRLDDATAALEEATRLDPAFSRAWYNLGLAYAAREQTDRALDALLRAESLEPNAAYLPYARATVLARTGRLQEAHLAARRALEIDPAFAAAAELLRALGGEAGR